MSAAVLLLLACACFAAHPEPEIRFRASWTDVAIGDIKPDPDKSRIVLHHTADFVKDADKKLTGEKSWNASVAHARRAQNFHRKIRGWKDIGYHFMIDWEGRILEGRPLELLGAHTEKRNTGSIGIVLMGDLSRQRLTKPQARALTGLLGWLMDRYRIPPERIAGHYQDKRTICPGTYLSNLWDPKASAVDFIQIAPRGRR